MQQDNINHPSHYNSHPSGVECIEIAEHYGFNLGNVIKYIWRAGMKSKGDVEDLQKALWYLTREIKKRCPAPDYKVDVECDGQDAVPGGIIID